jgi:replicative DNA helicase
MFKRLFVFGLLSYAFAAQAQQPPGANLDPSQLSEYLKGVQAHMLTMQDLSNKILAETNPQKQQVLKDQQLELMKNDYLQMMQQQGQR